MGMTMSQKILAKHAGLESVREGQLIRAKLDMVLGNDITKPSCDQRVRTRQASAGIFNKD